MGAFSGFVGLRFAGCKSFQLTSSTHSSLYPLPTILPNFNLDISFCKWKNNATVAQSKALYDQAVAQKPRNLLPLNHETRGTTAYDLLPYIIDLFQS